jgi:TrmH family RNA methyltransferase
MITSTKNTKIKEIKALQAKKRNRIKSGSFVVEGVRVLEDALASGLAPTLVLYSEDLQKRGMALIEKTLELGAQVESAMPHVMSAASDTKNSQGILMVFPFPNIPETKNISSVLILDKVRDPGNMGTLLRSASAADLDAVWLSPNCVDPFSPKVVRAGMGAHFKLPVISLDYEQIANRLSNHQLHLFISEMDADMNYFEANFNNPSAIVIGSEAVGTSNELLALPHTSVSIPMPGKVESLNAAVAGSLLIFELVRQRTGN